MQDANGCTYNDDVTINEPLAISVIESTTNVSCNAGTNGTATLTLSGGTGTLNVNWFGMNPNALPQGTHPYTITDANGCTYNDDVTINEPLAISVIENITDITCYGYNDGIATLTLSGGTGTLNVNWFGMNPNALSPGTHSYTITDANGCTYTDDVTIIEPAELLATSTTTNVSCNAGSDGTATLTLSGGTGTLNVNWFGMDPTALPQGTHTYTVTDANGCIYTNDVTINQADVLSSIFTTYISNMCYSDSSNLNSTYISANNSTGPIIDYTWIINAIPWSLTTPNPMPTLPILPQGISPIDYDITLTVNGGLCGTEISMETITIYPLPESDFTSIPPQTGPPCLITQFAGNPITIYLDAVAYDAVTNIGNTGWVEIDAPGANITVNSLPMGNPAIIYPVIGSGGFTQWPSISLIYLNPNTPTTPYQICITGLNQWGCPTTPVCCDVLVNPNGIQAFFTTMTREGCEDDSFYFIDNSIPSIAGNMITWCWDWDPAPPGTCNTNASDGPYPQNSGVAFTQDSLSIYYDDPGIFYVNQYAFNTIYDDNTYDSLPIIVHPKPDPDFNAPTTPICKDAPAYFTNTSSITALLPPPNQETITDHSWYVEELSGGGPINVNSYIVWNAVTGFPDLEYTFPSAGNWEVTLECKSDNITCECVDSFSMTVTVHDLPIANFSSEYIPACVNTQVDFDGSTTTGGSINSPTGMINEWDWDFGDPYCIPPGCNVWNSTDSANYNGYADHIYSVASTSYDVTLTVTDDNGCVSNPVENTIYVEAGIQASFSAPTVCFGESTTLDPSLSSSNATHFHWEIYDGPTPPIIVTTTNPNSTHNHPFSAAGWYTVSLTTSFDLVSGATCTSSPVTQQVHVWEVPDPLFTANTACEGDDTYFTNQTTAGIDAGISHYDWTFNVSGSPSSGISYPPLGPTADATHPFNSANTYLVHLTAWDNNLCSATYPLNVIVVPNPTAQITVNDGVCDLACIDVEDNSTQNSVFLIEEWNFNTNDPAVIECTPNTPILDNTSFQFSGPGFHTIYLDIEDQNGCTDTTFEQIEVYENPTADIDFTGDLCQDAIISFINNSTHGSGMSWDSEQWDFDLAASGATIITPPSDVSYSWNGTKTITLNIIDDNECEDTDIIDILISNLPTVSFNFNEVCAEQPTEFIDNSSENDNPIASWQWTFSNAPPEFFDPSNHEDTFEITFTISNNFVGSYETATLTVTDNIGCSDYQTSNIIPIHPLPNSNFIFNKPCEGEDFLFETDSEVNTSVFNDYIDGYGNPVWVFNSSMQDNSIPSWSPPADDPAGFYEVLHTTETNHTSDYDGKRCSYTHSEWVEIRVMPKITFIDSTFDPTNHCGENVIYDFKPSHQEVNDWNYHIDDIPAFDESDDIDFDYTFKKPGIYNLTIDLHNDNGCSDMIPIRIHIFPNPQANFTTNSDKECEGNPIIFTDSSSIPNDLLYDNGSSYIAEWQWEYGCGHTNNYIDFMLNTQHTYSTINDSITPYKPTLIIITDNYCVSEYQLSGDITIHPSPTAILEVTPLPEPGLFLFDGSDSYVGNNIQISSNGYNFIFDANEPNQSPLDYQEESIEYQFSSNFDHQNGLLYDVMLVVINESSILGCRDTAIESGIFVDYFKGLFVPNILAPNSSDQGETAIFLPKGKSLDEYRLQIFDKFGNLLWVSEKLNGDGKPIEGWDGTDLNGIALPQGTYVWKIHAIFSDGSNWEGMEYPNSNNKVKQGAVYLIR